MKTLVHPVDLTKMAWPFKDYDYYGNRYVNSKDPKQSGETMWYDRENIHDGKLPTECILCIEAENEMYTNYAHPKAHSAATTRAALSAESLAMKEKATDDYIDYYIFHYRREYIKIYKELYKKYKEEYSRIILRRVSPDDMICEYHLESLMQFYYKK
jgi:hypothetical protein